MKVLVTGGAGFIGHHLVGALVARGEDVSVIDDFSTGHRSRLDAFAHRITIVAGTILDESALDQAMAGCDVVFHEAAIPSVARSLEHPMQTNDVNVGGTIAVMLAAARHQIRRVVFAGSSSVYGIPATLPCREDQRPSPLSPYGASKLAGENYVHTLGRHHGIETVVLRYFNVFGPGQDPASEYAAVVPKFATAVLQGRQPVINGTGQISRDFTYIDNVIEANLLAAHAPNVEGLTCNVACGSRHSLLDLLEAIYTAAGRRIEPVYGPPRAGDIRDSEADISIAERELSYRVAVPFDEGISRTIDWYRGRGIGAIEDKAREFDLSS